PPGGPASIKAVGRPAPAPTASPGVHPPCGRSASAGSPSPASASSAPPPPGPTPRPTRSGSCPGRPTSSWRSATPATWSTPSVPAPMLERWSDLHPIKEYRDSTNARLFGQLVACFEKELGAKWPDLLDRLAGGGAVVAVKPGPNPAPALLVLQGKDEQLLHRF